MNNTVLSKEIFRWPVRVYWEDTDAGGIVFYANYLKFFERSRTEWLRAKGIHQQALREATGGMFVVSDAQVRYLKSARLDDELMVTTSLLAAGRAAMTIQQQALLTTAKTPWKAETPLVSREILRASSATRRKAEPRS